MAGSIGEGAVYVDKGGGNRILGNWREKTRIKPEFSSGNANLIGKQGGIGAEVEECIWPDIAKWRRSLMGACSLAVSFTEW